MIRVVFDTVVVLRAFINPQGHWGHLLAQHAITYRLIISRSIVDEYLEVLQRPVLVQRFDRLRQLDVDTLSAALSEALMVDADPIPPTSRDPKDDKFLATAKAGGAAFLVTEDKDLLVLGQYEESLIVTAAKFLETLQCSQ